ncbi:bifunctional DNA primase/polymerase [Parasphingopyxis marina]|uniref:Bifunctional DNA primase/polymerase n=1 Tax=Parasphingopyxis marina TaxID=2761622 RepID=A0A842HTA7_9SPHN|nr:bifunctional DNA primase/polymerase [Parasphingopyxis marina]MBC2777128.1 bifunctional DNA primase/polymerase [Parasphingopyxis marina]
MNSLHKNPENPNPFAVLVDTGFYVFPVEAGGKRPVVKWSEYRDRQPTDDELAEWHRLNFNVGLICGRQSGVLVLDIDSDEAAEFVAKLDLPCTPTAKTARGRHIYFRYPDYEVRNSVGLASHKLDVRGEGGYVVAPPSIHSTGFEYEWEISPLEADLAEVPENLKSVLLSDAANHRQIQLSAETPELATAMEQNRFAWVLECQLRASIDRLKDCKEGERNNTLNLVAFNLARYVAGAKANWEPFVLALCDASSAIGLGEAEARATCISAWNAGSKEPVGWMTLACEWAFLQKRDEFVHIESGKTVRPNAFNRSYNHLLEGEKGSISSILTKNEFVLILHDFGFDPTTSDRIYREGNFLYLNRYVPPGIESVPGDAGPFEDFLQYLVPHDEEREHLLKMIAWTVRNPGQKLGHALLLRSTNQGVGKTTLINIWRQLVGMENTRKANSDEVRGQFQGFLGDNLLVVIEELNLGSGLQMYNRLKDMISDDTVVINEKYVPVREAKNLASFVFLSNLKTPLLIEDTDRRIFFVDSPAVARDSDYYVGFQAWWRENLGVILQYLEHVDLSTFDPRAHPPETRAKAKLRTSSRSPLEQTVITAMQERVFPFSRDVFSLSEVKAYLRYTEGYVSSRKLTDALEELGAVPVAQHRTEGFWRMFDDGTFHWIRDERSRQSLWIHCNPQFWLKVPPVDRAAEFARYDGLLVNLDPLIRSVDQ